MKQEILPLGKLPLELLNKILYSNKIENERIILGPGVGIDCAVVEIGSRYLVLKSDPITFATDEIGWYSVQVNANDLATTGARPLWFLNTLLLPEGKTTREDVLRINQQLRDACASLGIIVVGGHTEVTHSIDRPILVGTLVGEVEKERLVTPRGARPGDRILLTKGIPIEATSILAREFPNRLQSVLTEAELREAADFLHNPGIGVTRDANLALSAGRVTAMHDPTEGGLAAALWELAEASGNVLEVKQEAIHIPELSGKICAFFGLNPLGTIASGALLMTVDPQDAQKIRTALEDAGIRCTEIGQVAQGAPAVHITANGSTRLLEHPEQDEIGKVYAD